MRDSLLNKKCLDVMHAGNVKDFSRLISEFTESLGFNSVAAMVITDHSPTLTEFQTVTNAPKAYLEAFENLDAGKIDPVSQHCKGSNCPIVWGRSTYALPHEREIWEHQAEFGLRSGIAFAMHLGRGRHYMFGADWNHDRCDQVPGYKQIFEEVLTFAAHAQAAAFELSMPSMPDPGNSRSLARCELETLKWTMDGKTSWEVARQMSISERHATLLIRRAMEKLECTSKYETVLRAIRLGLISCE